MLTVYLTAQAILWAFWGLVILLTREPRRPTDERGFDVGALDHEVRGPRYADLRIWALVFALQVAWPLIILYLL